MIQVCSPFSSPYKGRSTNTPSAVTQCKSRVRQITLSVLVTDSLSQLGGLIAAPILVILLVYFFAKVIRTFSRASSSKNHERDGTDELLQLLLLSELLNTRYHESDPKANSSADDKEA